MKGEREGLAASPGRSPHPRIQAYKVYKNCTLQWCAPLHGKFETIRTSLTLSRLFPSNHGRKTRTSTIETPMGIDLSVSIGGGVTDHLALGDGENVCARIREASLLSVEEHVSGLEDEHNFSVAPIPPGAPVLRIGNLSESKDSCLGLLTFGSLFGVMFSDEKKKRIYKSLDL